MPNIKSAEKRVLVTKVRTERNKAEKSALKTSIKRFDTAVTAGSHEEAESAYKAAVKSVDKAAAKGLIHSNKAAHTKSQMTVKLNAKAE